MRSILLPALSVLAATAVAFPITAKTDPRQVEHDLALLKEKTEQLQQQLETLESEAGTIRRTRKVSAELAGPHFGIDATYDGSKLLINEPSLNKDLALLRQKQHLNKAFGSVQDQGSRVQISGSVSSTYTHHSQAFGKDDSAGKSDISASGELDIAAQLNDWWTGYTKFDGNTTDLTMNFNQGFVTLGNIEEYPIYATLGYFYVPNGGYSSHMVTGSLPKSLGRIKGKALNIGYTDPRGPQAAVYGLVGRTHKSNKDEFDQWGANFEYAQDLYKFGLSFMNNMASSDGMKTPFTSGNTKVQRYVPAVDARASVKYSDYTLAGEYITALVDFDTVDAVYNSRGIRPAASHVEVVRSFSVRDVPSYLAVSFGHSQEALALKLPKSQVGATYSATLFKNTVFYVEYMHKNDYARGNTSTAGGNTVTASGLNDNSVSVEVDVYF